MERIPALSSPEPSMLRQVVTKCQCRLFISDVPLTSVISKLSCVWNYWKRQALLAYATCQHNKEDMMHSVFIFSSGWMVMVCHVMTGLPGRRGAACSYCDLRWLQEQVSVTPDILQVVSWDITSSSSHSAPSAILQRSPWPCFFAKNTLLLCIK